MKGVFISEKKLRELAEQTILDIDKSVEDHKEKLRMNKQNEKDGLPTVNAGFDLHRVVNYHLQTLVNHVMDATLEY